MSIFYIKEGDSAPLITATLKNPDGSNFSLNDVSGVDIIVAGARGGDNIINDRVDIVDKDEGVVRYRFDSTDTSTYGRYRVEFQVEYDGGVVETFPNDGYHTIMIQRNLEK